MNAQKVPSMMLDQGLLTRIRPT